MYTWCMCGVWREGGVYVVCEDEDVYVVCGERMVYSVVCGEGTRNI